MKNIFEISLIKILTVLFLLIFVACEKEVTDVPSETNDIENILINKSIGWEVTFSAGHDWPLCAPGCFPSAGPPFWIHIPCWGSGTNCTHTIGFSIFKSSNLFSIENLDKPYDVEVVLKNEIIDSGFPFPSRSVSYLVNDDTFWLNIPEQNIITINSGKNTFVLKGIYLSRTKAYSNK
ncbi:MAG: hypothetical protein PHG67_01840 [Bacteroidales bacterium]|nr:hypothetical protein [Bacteroidales bacterium]HOI31142.1 hypothetical protein [Bacteroidales bacterium]